MNGVNRISVIDILSVWEDLAAHILMAQRLGNFDTPGRRRCGGAKVHISTHISAN